MPFGMENAPATFQRVMDRVLSGLQGIELFVYMDDIVIYAKSLKEHNEKLEKLLGRLKTANLVLQPEKCKFLCKEIGYLGHVIAQEGVKPDPKKLQAVMQFPQPKNRKNVKQFLGLAGYYRRFVPGFAQIAKPLNNLLKKDVVFKWNEDTQLSFNKLKEILCSSPILQYPDFSRPFIVTVDASDFAMGAVLSQGIIGKDLPIAYASRALQGAQLKYNVTEKELLAVIFAVIQFRPYIYGRKFTLVTDHRPLVWLHQLNDPTLGSKLARWKVKLREYTFDVVHKPGKINSNADALSRNLVKNSGSNKIEDIDSDASEEDGQSPVVVHDLRCSDIPLEEEIWYHEFPVERLFVNCLREGCINSTESEGGVNSVENSDVTKNNCQEIEDLEGIACVGTSKRKLSPNFRSNQNFTGLKRVRTNDVNEPPQKLFKTIVGKVYSRSENVEKSTETPTNSIEMPPIFEFDTCSGEVYAGSEKSILNTASTSDKDRMSDEELETCSERILSISRDESCYKSCARISSENVLEATPDQSTDDEEISENLKRMMVGEFETIIVIDEDGEKGTKAVRTVPIQTEDSVSGRNLLTPLFKTCKDKLWMRDDHLINFVSCDHFLTTPIGRELIDHSILKLSDLNKEKVEVGQVISLRHGKRLIFNLFVKEKFDDIIFATNIESAVATLKSAMMDLKLKTISISRRGNGFDRFPWATIELIFRTYFGKGDYSITVCTGEVTIPPVDQRLQIIKESHDSAVGGHKGVFKTLERVRERFYWKGVKEEVQNYVKTCESCQKKKLVRVKTKLPMCIIDTPIRVFEKLQIDLVGPLPKSDIGNEYMLTWQDCLSKFSGAIPLSKIDAPTIAVSFAEQFICRFGCPESIQTDQGPQFMSEIMAGFAELFKIKQYKSSAYHPQSLGALERSHHTFVEYLRHYCESSNWDQWLPFAMFSFNTSVHESTGITPHEIVFGRKAILPSEFADEKVPLTYVKLLDDILNRLVTTESMVHARLEAAKRRCKKYYDRKVNEMNFIEGQYI